GSAFVEVNAGFPGKTVFQDDETCAGVEDQRRAGAIDGNRQGQDAAATRQRKSLGAAAGRSGAAALGRIIGKHGATLAGVVAGRVERDPALYRQHGVAKLPELLVIARHLVVADAADAVFVAEQLDRGDVVVDRAFGRSVAVARQRAQEIAVVAVRLELDQVSRDVFGSREVGQLEQDINGVTQRRGVTAALRREVHLRDGRFA